MRPARRLLLLLALLAALAILASSAPLLGQPLPGDWRTPWWGVLTLLGLVAGLDALWLWRTPTPEVRRHLPAALLQGHWSEARLELRARARRTCRLQVGDLPPPELELRGLPRTLQLRPGASATLDYALRAAERGTRRFAAAELLLDSPLGLWQIRHRPALAATLRVLPDCRSTAHHHLPGDASGRANGQRPLPYRGNGREFHQLREFRDGDSLRQIDWKATARQGRPVAREYQQERDRQILLLLDGGRRMRSRDDTCSHFDHSLAACLRLARLALQQGDAVGVLVFGGARPCHLPPAKGQRQWHALLAALHDLQPGTLPGDWTEAATILLERQRRQALVLLVSNLTEEDEEDLPAAAARIASRHQLQIASLREALLAAIAREPLQGYEQALRYCAALDHQARRTALHARLAGHGLPLFEVEPALLGAALLERYLHWKHGRR